MGSTTQAWWDGNPAGMGRAQRQGGHYYPYTPHPTAEAHFPITGLEATLDAATEDLARLDATAPTILNSEAIARLLLRAEAVGSSRVEGLQLGPRRMLRAEVTTTTDTTATEVLGNIHAMEWAVAQMAAGAPFTTDLLLQTHRQLLVDTHLHQYAGQLRTEQNWIGGTSPVTAEFVPPPPGAVPALLEDLAAFINRRDLPALIQAAIAHAQFETIHPFIDGNGRTGRALIHMVLRARGLISRTVPPLSLLLARDTGAYIGALTAYRQVTDEPLPPEAYLPWVRLLCEVCSQAAGEARQFEKTVQDLQDGWRQSSTLGRSGSSARRLIELLPSAPVLTVDTAAGLLGVTFETANKAVRVLLEAGILVQSTAGRRNRVFEARELIEAFVLFERRLASPAGDTQISRPARAVPALPER